MKRLLKIFGIVIFFIWFSTFAQNEANNKSDFTIAFGSCNKQFLENKLWDDILEQKPDVWIWGGDNVYSDTDNMVKLKSDYDKLLNNVGYKALMNSAKIMGTWDDHDYGLGDGGVHFKAKKESEQAFLDFFGVPKDDVRRKREGVYYSETVKSNKGSIKIIILDTRYFRTDLTDAENSSKRYQPNVYGEGTILGTAQWHWLEEELKTSQADFNIIVSSIQVLSNQHGFETWGNFPHEVDKLKQLLIDSKAKGVIILSGDRHISEFSKENISGLNYPLIDFTSSGLTHVYSNFSGEYNPYRIGEVVKEISFGLLGFNFETKEVTMKMIGDHNKLQQEITQQY